MHPVATSDPLTVRWAIAADRVPGVGVVSGWPSALKELHGAGVVDSASADLGGVTISLSPGHSWSADGSAVREALWADLESPTEWSFATGASLSDQVADLLDGPVAMLARSHGGSITVDHIEGQRVTVRPTGACNGCPAASSTLRQRIEAVLRSRTGCDVEVVAVSGRRGR